MQAVAGTRIAALQFGPMRRGFAAWHPLRSRTRLCRESKEWEFYIHDGRIWKPGLHDGRRRSDGRAFGLRDAAHLRRFSLTLTNAGRRGKEA